MCEVSAPPNKRMQLTARVVVGSGWTGCLHLNRALQLIRVLDGHYSSVAGKQEMNWRRITGGAFAVVAADVLTWLCVLVVYVARRYPLAAGRECARLVTQWDPAVAALIAAIGGAWLATGERAKPISSGAVMGIVAASLRAVWDAVFPAMMMGLTAAAAKRTFPLGDYLAWPDGRIFLVTVIGASTGAWLGVRVRREVET